MSKGFVVGDHTKRRLEDILREEHGRYAPPGIPKNKASDRAIMPVKIVTGGATHTEGGLTFVEGKMLVWDEATAELVELDAECWVLELE